MNNKKLIYGIFIIVLVIIVVGLFFSNKLLNFPTFTPPGQNITTTPPIITSFSENMSCGEMYNEIENDLDKANYCERNSDCNVIMLGGAYIRFGCYHYVNKDTDKEQIYQKMSVYDKKCRDMINKCVPAPAAQCISSKCVYVEAENKNIILSELEKLNIIIAGQPEQIKLKLPSILSDANWGLKKIVCEEGGYNLSAYAGQTVLLTQYLTNEVYGNTEPLNVWVISSGGQVVCVYKTVTENSTMEPGVFSVKENSSIKKK